MSYSPPDLSHHHTRQPSLPTVYENNDPYRVTRKSPTIGKIYKKKILDILPINLFVRKYQ